ncbi:heme-degrading domain-containing protein [Pantoea osteomyelitidis]|uniref:Heme-degrading domain-containing protein n=1 Tax=Pantoea osteomyelitidis TaxID=3230026 RepID=A0ABW7Q1D1_9GAMM
MPSPLSADLLLQQEADSRLAHFDFRQAWQLGLHMHTRAMALSAPVALEVYAFGQVLFIAALPGSSAENLEWIKRKRNSVLRCSHSSLYLEVINQQKGERMAAQPWINQAEYCDHGGAFPLLNESGCIIGAASVSGLPSSEDHALALWAIQQLQSAAS